MQFTFIVVITVLTCCAVSNAVQITCPFNHTFGNRVSCINSSAVLIKRGYWIGQSHDHVTVVGFCKFCQSYSSPQLGEDVAIKLENQCSYKRNVKFSTLLQM